MTLNYDLINWSIIGLLGILLVWFVIRHLYQTSKLKKKYKSLKELSDLFKTEQVIVVEDLPHDQKQWVRDNLIVSWNSLNGSKPILERQNNRFLAKRNVSHIVPNYEITRHKIVPALLTSLGITGTFIGITIGLAEFDTSNIGQNSASLMTSAAQLLEGMKTAFYTSLAGLSSSAVFMLLSLWCKKAINDAREIALRSLHEQVIEVSAVSYLADLVNASGVDEQKKLMEAQTVSAKAMSDLSSNLGAMFNQFEHLSNSLDSEVLGKAISQSVNKCLTESVTPVLASFKDELSLIKQIKEDNYKEVIEAAINGMRTGIVEPVSQVMNQSAASLDKSNQLTETLNTNVGLVLERMGNTVESINTFQQDTMTKLQDFAENLKNILSSFKDDTQGVMATITSKVEDVLDKSIEGMEKQRYSFDESAKQAAEAFDGMNNSIQESLDHRVKTESELFSQVEIRLNSLLDKSTESFEVQNRILSATGEEATALMIKARDELERGLGDIDSKVVSMSRTVQSELEAFREQYQTNLQDFFKQQNNLLEDSLGKQRDNLLEVVLKFKDVFEQEYQKRQNFLEELTGQYAYLQKSAETIQRLAKAVGLHESAKMAELQDAAATIGKQVAYLKKEYAQASATFQEITEGVPKAIDDYYQRANGSIEKFFSDFDQSASKIHNRLAQAADYLIEARVQEQELLEKRA